MSELAKSVVYPSHFYYLLEFVHPNPVALQYFYHRYPDLAGTWPDLSGYTPDDLNEMEAYIRTLHLTYYLSDMTKDVPDNDDAA
jgi:hypothetical protein